MNTSLATFEPTMSLGFTVSVLLVYLICFLWIGRTASAAGIFNKKSTRNSPSRRIPGAFYMAIYSRARTISICAPFLISSTASISRNSCS